MENKVDNSYSDLSSVRSKITEGFSTLIVREFAIKFSAFIGQLFLARFLSPEEFGTFAIVIFIITFFGLFSDIGLSPAIIQKKVISTHQELSTIFIIKMILSLFLVVGIYILSPFLPLIYTSFQGAHVLMARVLSITLLLTALRSLPVTLLERDLKYKAISTIDVTGIIAYYVVTTFCALMGFGMWSFIIGVVIKELIEVFIAFFYNPWFPVFFINISEIKKMLQFGLFIQAGGIVNFFYTAMIPVVGGIRGGAYAVGLLDWGFNIVSVPESVTNNFSRVAFSVFPKLQHDKSLLKKAMEKSISMLLIITLFFTLLIYGFADEVVRKVYTEKWIAGIPALYYFAAAIPFFAIIGCYSQAILSLGKSKAVFLSTLFANGIGLLLAFFLTQVLGFIGVAVASALSVGLLFLFYVYITERMDISINLFHTLLPKLSIACFTLLFVFILNTLVSGQLIFLFLKLIITTIFYVSLMFIFAKQEIIELLSLLLKTFIPHKVFKIKI